MGTIRAYFFKIGALFSIFKKGQGRPPPSPLSCAPGFKQARKYITSEINKINKKLITIQQNCEATELQDDVKRINKEREGQRKRLSAEIDNNKKKLNIWKKISYLKPIPDRGRGAKSSPLPVFPCNFYEVGISPQNFLTFTFNRFATLLQNFKVMPGTSPKLLNLNQGRPSKKLVFLAKSL